MGWHGKLKQWFLRNPLKIVYAIILFVLAVFFVVTGLKLKPEHKLLIVLVDGFRWDYYNLHREHLPGFQSLLKDGVQVEYVEPIFPSMSLPSWTSIATGVYPAYHNVLGNYMIRPADTQNPEAMFDFKGNSSMNPVWWQSAEPLWITATKRGHKTYLANFARCDVPYRGMLPTECIGYDHDRKYDLEEQLNIVVEKFNSGFTLAMIQYDPVDIAGHEYGPDSEQVLTSIKTVDSALKHFLDELKGHNLQDNVNVIITSDHGMTSIKQSDFTMYVKLQDYLENPDEDIYKVMDFGAGMMINTVTGKSRKVYQELSKMPGVDVYNKSNIPDAYHVKDSLYFPDIWLVARSKYFIVGLAGDKQLPNDKLANTVEPFLGTHGYTNMSDMRTIFFARGPSFKKGIVHSSIKLVDQYQIFTHVLNLVPQGRNGSWKNVAGLVKES